MLKPLTVWITTNWKIPKEMEYQTTLTVSWETCMQIKQQQLEPNMKQQAGSKLGKEDVKAVHPAYLTFLQCTSCEMPGWVKHKLESRLSGEISPTSDTQVIQSNGRKPRETRELLDEGERGKRKSWLKLNIQKSKIMASGPITSWQTEGEKEEAVTDFIFLGSKITADSDCSHEMKRHLLLGKKAMMNLASVLKNRDITSVTRSVQSKLWFSQ